MSDSGDKLAIPHFYNDAGVVKRCWAHWTTASSYLPFGANFFSAAPYGATRTWLGLGDQNGRAMRGLGVTSAAWAAVLPWE